MGMNMGHTDGHGTYGRTWDTNPDMGYKSGHLLIKIVLLSKKFLFVGNITPKCFSTFLWESTKYPENLIKIGGLVFETMGQKHRVGQKHRMGQIYRMGQKHSKEKSLC